MNSLSAGATLSPAPRGRAASESCSAAATVTPRGRATARPSSTTATITPTRRASAGPIGCTGVVVGVAVAAAIVGIVGAAVVRAAIGSPRTIGRVIVISSARCPIIGGTHVAIVGAGIIGCWIRVIDAAVVCRSNPAVARSRRSVIARGIASATSGECQSGGTQQSGEKEIQESFHREDLVKVEILSVPCTLSCLLGCFLPDIFDDGCEGDFLEGLGVLQGKEGASEPWMKVPPGEIDELAREVRLISECGGQPVGEGVLP